MGAQRFPREVRQVLTRTGGFLEGWSHSLQPYVGCEFSCTYCYVRELAVQKCNPYGLAWGSWVSPKTNAPERLAALARRGGLAAARIFCSSATDPYTPSEARLRLTRGCLEVMVEHPPAALLVQTRSPLVLRDADLLARIPTARVSITITTDDESVRRLLEPDSPSLARRLEALAGLGAAGVPTQAALAPLLPCDPRRLAERLAPLTDRVLVDDFFRGDGAGGRRSREAIARLRAAGHGAWTEPGYAAEAAEIFRAVLGAERVLESPEGWSAFN